MTAASEMQIGGIMGTPIPELVVRPTHMDLFMFSAATWNRHQVHYSKDAAQSEGLPDVVVHRALLGNYLTRALDAWLGEAGEISALSWKVVRSAVPGNALHCGGVIDSCTAIGGDTIVAATVSITDDSGEPIVLGQAQMRLFMPREA